MDRLLDRITSTLDRIARFFALLGGVALVALMLLLVANVVLRAVAAPINGTFELVSMLGVLVSGLALAEAQRSRSHVSISILTDRLPRTAQLLVSGLGTVAALALFVQLATSLIVYGLNQRLAGALTEALRIPFWPSVLVLAAGVIVLVGVLIADLARIVQAARATDDAPADFW